MAVSLEDQSTSNEFQFPAKSEIEKNCENQSSPKNTMGKTDKKERRKPELQIYRPGKGFQKNSKQEDTSKTEKSSSISVIHSSSDPNIPLHCNSSDPKSDLKNIQKTEKGNNHDNQNKSLKNTKERKPDIQVYIPKVRVASKVTGKSNTSTNGCSSKWESDENEITWKKSSSHCDRQNSPEVQDIKKHSKKDSASVKCSENKVTPNVSSSSPVTTSWADQVEESDRSNSRASPDNKLCNGISDENVHLHLSSSNSLRSERNNRVTNQKSNKEDHRKQRNKRNHRRNDDHRVAEDRKLNDTVFDNRNKADLSSSVQKRNDDSLKKPNKSSRGFGNPANERKINTNSLDRVKSRQKDNLKNSSDNKNSPVEFCDPNSNALPNEAKCDRRKKEKESVLPPRFQKQKSPNPDKSSSSSCRSGGILKIPVERNQLDSAVEMLDKLHIPKTFPEPQKMFIHKQLFDPNNPSKPEIINIPAPVPPPHMPYNKMNHYYGVESINSPYIPAPVETGVYIPPPQPPMATQPYRFLPPDISPGKIPNGYLSDGVPSLHSVRPPQMNGTFQPPSHAFTEVMPLEPGKKRLKPIVEKNLHEIVLLEKEINSALAKGIVDNNLNSLKQCRWKLQLRYENIILADPKYCAEKNPEQSLWKTVYHQIIETLRKKLEEDKANSEEIRETLLNIILEGTMFYENLLEKQQETYGFKLSKLFEMECLNTSCLSDQLRCVLISVQKNLIYLGDLARYKEQVSQTSNYGKARSWYLKAQQIAPKNGKPYHQLALLAFNTKRKLDAVYYYMRSLAASNPFLSAKESLLSLFEEAKRKYEIYEKKRQQENMIETEIFEDKTTERCEIWIKNDGSSTNRPAELEKNIDACDLKKLSDVELNKRFVTSFLHVHGKLFTKVGMETFPDALNNMLKEFFILLQRSPIPLTSSRLLQLLAINIFSVTNSSLKENGREHGGRSILQEQALYTSMAMMSMLMDRCCLLHVAHKSLPEYANQLVSDDFAQLLPSVKIWTDWMSCQRCLWPPPCVEILEKLNVQLNNNIWLSFADFLSVLQEIDVSDPVIVTQHTNNCEAIVLEEDSAFAGFVPLLGAIQNPAFALSPFDKDKAKHCLRISKIQFFGDYLCGISPPYLEFDVESKRFVALVNHRSFEETYEGSVLLSSEDSFREEHLNDELHDKSINKSSVSKELQVLWSRKEALSKAREKQQKYQAQVQAVLHKHRSQRPIVLKIKPRYLVPDTNCFIDHLKLFKNILASTDFHLVIPLVVINELDGLAKGTRENVHSSRVTALSREAIHFLEQQFASRHPHLRAITSKGSILDTISFRSEEMGQNKGTNDDLILTCCLYYCKDRAENFMPKNRDDPLTLFREVVLLTDDRNLRVKALTHHVPVRDLLSFLQWANS